MTQLTHCTILRNIFSYDNLVVAISTLRGLVEFEAYWGFEVTTSLKYCLRKISDDDGDNHGDDDDMMMMTAFFFFRFQKIVRDLFRPEIVKIQAILAIFRPLKVPKDPR